MRILVDEDLASRSLLRELGELDGVELVRPAPGESDEAVWARAQSERAAILTGNVVDFLGIAARHADHHGLLIVYRGGDPASQLRSADLVRAIERITRIYPAGIEGITLAVNSFRDSNEI